jgi:matrix metalloproteinase-14 (membrane-inserted)
VSTFKKIYFFKDARYWRYDLGANRVEDGWPKDTATEWRRWPTTRSFAPGNDPASSVRAALNARNGKAYFFFGPNYYRFDIAIDRMYLGPLKVSDYWPGVGDVTAAVNLGNDVVCLFQGSACLRFNMTSNHVLDGYPKSIAADWPGMPDAPVDAALDYGDGTVCFFVGKQYARFDLQAKTVSFRSIAADWHGLPDDAIDDAIEWSDDDIKSAWVPIYDPSYWNTAKVQRNNNCYSYACNRDMQRMSEIDGSHQWRPGFGSGHPVANPKQPEPPKLGELSNDKLDAACRADGLVKIDDPDKLECPPGQYPIMLFRDIYQTDFHFIRRDADGMWSQKIGGSPATNLDTSGRRITDPRTADRGKYSEFVAAYSVDRSRVRLGG